MGDSFLQRYNMTTEDYGLLFSAYAIPNLVLVFVSGIVLDRIGPNISGIFFNLLIVATTALMTWSNGNYTIYLIAFAIFGIGAQSIGYYY